MVNSIVYVSTWIWQRRYWLVYWVVVFGIYWANTFHTNFSDEFDNIVGGWYINHGILPYIGFFTHHNPGAYFLSALITLFTKQSFVVFRIVWGGMLFLAVCSSYFFLRKHVGIKDTWFFLGYTVLVGLSATYYWGHMMLSETIVGYLLIPVYGLVFIKALRGQVFTYRDVWFVSIGTALALFTSFTFIFSTAILVGFVALLYLRQIRLIQDIKRFCISTGKIMGIFILPYVIFLAYLIVSGSLPKFYFQSITYNRDYYIYNFPKVSGQISQNPARYALSILYETSNQFNTLSFQVRDFNFAYPINITLLVANVTVFIYLFLRKKNFQAVVIYLFIVYLNARAEPLNSGETDFHSTVYIMVSLFNLSFIVWEVWHALNAKLSSAIRLINSTLFLFVGVYGVFLTAFFARNFADKTYAKIMGQAPIIYDDPVVAPIINKIVSKDEYFWIGPFEFQELLYINGRLPSKYHWFLPAHERSEQIRTEFISDLTRNRPKIIVFKGNLGYFGKLPQEFNYPIANFLRDYYFRLIDLEAENKKFKPTRTDLHNFDIAENFYFDKSKKNEIVEQLLRENIIKPAE